MSTKILKDANNNVINIDSSNLSEALSSFNNDMVVEYSNKKVTIKNNGITHINTNSQASQNLVFADPSVSHTITIPAKDGTIAVDGDVVHKAGDETIAGQKTFTGEVTTINGLELHFGTNCYGLSAVHNGGFDFVAPKGLNITNAFNNYGAGVEVDFTNKALWVGFNWEISPYSPNSSNLGNKTHKWNDIYISGGLRDGNNDSHKLLLPSTSGWTVDKTIAVDEDVIHKGTSQSSPAAAETRYGNLTIDGDLSVGNGSGTTRSFSLFSGGGTHTLKPDLNSTLRTLRYSRRGSTAGNIDIDFPNKSGILATTDDIPTNILNDTAAGSLHQLFDSGYGNTIDMSVKNPNAWALYQQVSGAVKDITKGATGQYATSLGGISAAAGKRALADGTNTIAIGKYSHAEGDNSVALGNESHAEGNQTVTNGSAAHSEGFNTQALGNNTHAEGAKTIAYAENAHSEGYNSIVGSSYIIVNHDAPTPTPGPEPEPGPAPTPAELDALNGDGAHAEGHNNFVLGCGAHVEGDLNRAYGRLSHAEGHRTQTGELILRKTEDNKDYYTPNQDKQFQHAEGDSTKAIGHASHAGGYETIARYDYQTVVGKYNANKEHTLFEVGYGWADGERHNALEVYDDGHIDATTIYQNGISLEALKLGSSNKDKFLHTNASTGALEWATVPPGVTITTTSGSESISDGTNTLNIVTRDSEQTITKQKVFDVDSWDSGPVPAIKIIDSVNDYNPGYMALGMGLDGLDDDWVLSMHDYNGVAYSAYTRGGIYRRNSNNQDVDLIFPSTGGTLALRSDMAPGVQYLTTAPTSANPTGLKFVVLSSEPATKYSGYVYIITGA